MADKPYTCRPKGGRLSDVRGRSRLDGRQVDQRHRAAAGQPAVVHHIIIFVLPPEGAAQVIRASAGTDFTGAFAPGLRPRCSAGHGPLRAGRLEAIFQMHYTPNGTRAEGPQLRRLQLRRSQDGAGSEVALQHGGNFAFKIPAGADNHEVESATNSSGTRCCCRCCRTCTCAAKHSATTLIYPDGTEGDAARRAALRLQLADELSPGRAEVACRRARSCTAWPTSTIRTDNLANPDPTKPTSRWGDQTWEEMMIGWFEICLADQDLSGKLAADNPAQ